MSEIVERRLSVNGDLEAGYATHRKRSPDISMGSRSALAGGQDRDKEPARGSTMRASPSNCSAPHARHRQSFNPDFSLCARTDAFLTFGATGWARAIPPLHLYRKAGADVSYPPGVADIATIRTLGAKYGPLKIVIGLGSSGRCAPVSAEAE